MDRSSSSSLCDEIIDLGGIVHPSFDDDATISSRGDSPSDDTPVVGGVETAKVVTEGDVKPPPRRKGVHWPQVERKEGNKLVFPFLDRKKCDRDYQLCSIIAMQGVFQTNHGTKAKVWEEVRSLLAPLPDSDGNPLFPDGINSINTLRRRTDVLMRWIKKYRDTAAVRSGTDNEVHSDFINLLENLLEQKESSEEKMAEEAKEATKIQARKVSEAECIRLAAMNTTGGKKRLQEMWEASGRKPRAKIPKTPSPLSSTSPCSGSVILQGGNPPKEIIDLVTLVSDQNVLSEKNLEKQREMEKEKSKERSERKVARELREERREKFLVDTLVTVQNRERGPSNDFGDAFKEHMKRTEGHFAALMERQDYANQVSIKLLEAIQKLTEKK